MQNDNLPPYSMLLSELVPHPYNAEIYGENEDVSDLLKVIEISKWIKPIVITPELLIISGHRRYKVAIQLGWERVPVEIQEFGDESDKLRRLLNENMGRNKTHTQRARELLAWETLYRSNLEPSPQAPRKKAIEKAGISCERLANDLKRVLERINELEGLGKEKEKDILTAFNDDAPTSALQFIKKDDPKGAVLQSLACDTAKYEQIMRGELRIKDVRANLKKKPLKSDARTPQFDANPQDENDPSAQLNVPGIEKIDSVPQDVEDVDIISIQLAKLEKITDSDANIFNDPQDENDPSAQLNVPGIENDKPVGDPQDVLLENCLSAAQSLNNLPIQPKDIKRNVQKWANLISEIERITLQYKPFVFPNPNYPSP